MTTLPLPMPMSRPAGLRPLLKRAFPKLALYRRVLRVLVDDESSYLHQTGWLRSLAEQRPVDAHGNPLPWMNYSVVRFLQERLHGELDLFEYGSGFSTGFYAERVRSVVSVEYDPGWVAQLRPTLAANVELIEQPQDIDGDYCRTILRTGRRFDVVVVDGRDRVHCVEQAFRCLSERGVVLLDDSQRERYRPAFELAVAQGFAMLSFEGLKPTGQEIDRTTLFYRLGNCLGL
ncbi:MAG TPA: hypothetical protein VFR90_07350 [Methylibium sp.]|uniref:hypothetical protein n=1 Tax=Methylibium sp. TaxID=2067992 RepID=UPI002DBC2505|nr:hypothetical protein [Methylibium sp.]HEU4458922.1 hypothetical protein [Methylibium sp.]